MSDLISRQELLNAIFQKEYGHDYDENTDILGLKYVDIIKGMPSVETEQNLQPNLQQTCNQLASDCISRQAALDAIYALCDEGGTLKENPWRDNPHIDAITDAIENLPSVEPERKTGKWIPCSERLPEPDTFVLTYHRHLSFDYQYVSSIDETTGEWSGFCGNLSDEVLAWMPLPDAYKGETI